MQVTFSFTDLQQPSSLLVNLNAVNLICTWQKIKMALTSLPRNIERFTVLVFFDSILKLLLYFSICQEIN